VAPRSRHLHAYWPLRHPLAVDELEDANRRLAYALGADVGAVTNAAAILRPPGTLNFKDDVPVPVRPANELWIRLSRIMPTLSPELLAPTTAMRCGANRRSRLRTLMPESTLPSSRRPR
jgi:hypothetical protein